MRSVVAQARLLAKRILVRWFPLIEYCHDCGIEQPVVWTAGNALYAEVMDLTPERNMGGVVCPTCFDRRASAKGKMLRWIPVEANP